MITNFDTVVEGISFEFHSLNIKRLQLFQVYVMLDGNRIRFHMQITGNGEFVITDKYHCPDIYWPLENTLSDRILALAAAD